MNHCELIATFRKFSKLSSEYGGSVSGEYSNDDKMFEWYFRPVFYANGDCKENEGYVSVMFYEKKSILMFNSHIEFFFSVSVLDVAGNKRFLQTFVYIHDSNSPSGLENGVPKFGLDKFLTRETLFNDPAELLPNDCLAICIEFDYVKRDFCGTYLTPTFEKHGEKYFISLDSEFGKELCKVCDYFQRTSDTPMTENKTRRVYIPYEEIGTFDTINLINTQTQEIEIESVEDLCQLYTVADKYDFQAIIETCSQMIKSILRRMDDPKVLEHVVESITMILELSEMYKDVSLKESVKVYLEIKNNFETNGYAFKEELNKKLSSEWSCELNKIHEWVHFKLRRIEGKKPEMEFYK